MQTTQSAEYNEHLTKEILNGIIGTGTRLDNRSVANMAQVSKNEQCVIESNLELQLFSYI